MGYRKCFLDPPLPQDAASFKAEPEPEPEPGYSMEAADFQDAGSQQGLAYASDPIYEAAEAPGHYPAGTGGGAPRQIPVCLCSPVKVVSVSPRPDLPHLACAGGVLVSPAGRAPGPPPPGLGVASYGGYRKAAAAAGWWVGRSVKGAVSAALPSR